MTPRISRLSILLVVLVTTIYGCARQPGETATIMGQVSIGPLVPVMREGEPEPTAAPEVYAARQIVIYRADGRVEVARVGIGPTGKYSVTLPVGAYVVDINRAGIDSADGLPRQIELHAGETIRVDVEIDTGIR